MTKSFRGEGDLMVDALVAASKEAFNQGGGQPMPGYGRDLVPFFDGGDVAPLSKPAGGGRVNNGAGQPPPPPPPGACPPHASRATHACAREGEKREEGAREGQPPAPQDLAA